MVVYAHSTLTPGDVAVGLLSVRDIEKADQPKRVFITAAEVSGDVHAAELIAELRRLDPTIIIEGHGGPRMRSAGAVVHRETVGKAAMGASGVLRVFEMLSLLRWTRKYLASHRPDLQICCDSPAMNFHFAKLAKKLNVPVLFYVAPQLWAWREGRMKKVRKWIDRLACILPFEEDYFKSHGVNATFVGHPLFDELPERLPHPPAEQLRWRPPIVGLLPGSRRSEAVANFPPLLLVAERLRAAFPGIKFLVPTTSATLPVVTDLAKEKNDTEIGQDVFDEMVARCDLCITVSGTATLHVAGHFVPMIVVYRLNPLSWHLVGRWLMRTKTFALVNLLGGNEKYMVPEFVPWTGSTDSVADCAIDLLSHPEKLDAQSASLRQLVETLDKPGASANVARMAMEMMASDGKG